MSIVSPMDSMVPHYPQTGGPPDKGLISDAAGAMFAETPAPGESIQDQVNALSAQTADIATFLEERTYTIKYDANGGEGAPVDNNVYVVGDIAFVITDPAPTREGYNFLGYSPISDAATATDFSEGLPIVSYFSGMFPDRVIMLYAVWAEAEQVIVPTPGGDPGAVV